MSERELGSPEEAAEQGGAWPELKLEGRDWVLPSDPKVIGTFCDALTEQLKLKGWGAEEVSQIITGATEAVNNAIRHGNLELKGDHGYAKPEDYIAARDAAMASELGKRLAHVTVDITPEQLLLVVRDEGKGFDPKSLPDPTDEINLLKEGGRGVFLMYAMFDKVQYNEAGNEVRLEKLRRAAT